MIQNIGELPVTDDEWLARYIVHKEHVREDKTVKPDVFIPYKWVELSVTRHLGLTESEIWEAGKLVARQLQKSLRGRSDIQAVDIVNVGLNVVPKPLIENPNHADVIGWPVDKPSQKELALRIAQKTQFKTTL
jgi:hypothetical protein